MQVLETNKICLPHVSICLALQRVTSFYLALINPSPSLWEGVLPACADSEFRASCEVAGRSDIHVAAPTSGGMQLPPEKGHNHCVGLSWPAPAHELLPKSKRVIILKNISFY